MIYCLHCTRDGKKLPPKPPRTDPWVDEPKRTFPPVFTPTYDVQPHAIYNKGGQLQRSLRLSGKCSVCHHNKNMITSRAKAKELAVHGGFLGALLPILGAVAAEILPKLLE